MKEALTHDKRMRDDTKKQRELNPINPQKVHSLFSQEIINASIFR